MFFELVFPIEEHLASVRKVEDDRKAAIKEEKEAKERARIDAIRARITSIQKVPILLVGEVPQMILAAMDSVFAIEIDATFEEFEPEAMRVKEETLALIKKAYDAAVESEKKATALEKQRLEQEIERKRIAEENRKIEEERAKIEAEKKVEQARRDLEEITRQAKERAEGEAKEKIERETREKKEKEEAETKELEKKAAQASDKEKLLAFADAIESIAPPKVNSETAFSILADALRAMRGIVAMIRKEC